MKTIPAWILFAGLFFSNRCHAEEVQREGRVFDLRSMSRAPEFKAGAMPPRPGPLALASEDERYNRPDVLGSLGEWMDDDQAQSLNYAPLDPDQVGDAIRNLIDEDGWSNSNNDISTGPGSLQIVQTRKVLDDIGRFLEDLEAHLGRTFQLEAALVPESALDRAAPGWRRPDASPWLEAEAFDRALEAAGSEADLLSAALRGGQWHRFYPSAQSRRVTDFEVNQTGAYPVLNPVIENQLEGAYGDALLLPSPGGGWYRADLALGRRLLEGESEKRATAQGEFELLRWREVHLAATIAAPFGKTVVLGCFSAAARGESPDEAAVPPFAALLRVRTMTFQDGTSRGGAGPRDPELPLVLDAGLLLAPPPDHSLNDGEARTVDVRETPGGLPLLRPLIEPDLLETSLRQALPREERERVKIRHLGRLALIGGTPAQMAAIRARLEALARGAARLVQVELWQLSVSAAEAERLGSAGALVDAAILEPMAPSAARYARAVGWSGLPFSLAAVRMRHYVSDVEGVSGGTSFAAIEVSDPTIGALGEGLRLNALARCVPETDWVRLDLQAEAADPPVFQRQARARLSQGLEDRRPADAVYASGAAGDKKLSQPPWLALDLPESASEYWRHVAAVPAGRAVLLRIAPDPDAAGRQRLLIAAAQAFDLPKPAGR